MPQHGLLYERLSKSLALRSPLEALRDNSATCHQKLGTDEPTLVVEIVHDVCKALPFLTFVIETHQILHWYLHIVEDNKCRTSRAGVSCFNCFGINAHVSTYEEHADAIA